MPQVVHTVGVDAHGPNSYATFAECVSAASEGDMAMVLPGDYPERIVLPFAMDVIGRVKGKVRFCPPLPDPPVTLEQEQEEDERAIAAILAKHLGSQAPPVGADATMWPSEDENETALSSSNEHADVACSLYAAPGGLGGRLVDIIIEGGIAVSAPDTSEITATSRPASRGHCGAWTLEGVQVHRAPYDGLHVSGGAHVTLRDCSISACGGRGCIVTDHATLVAHSTDWIEQSGGGLYAGDSTDVTLTRCNIDGPRLPTSNGSTKAELPAVPPLSVRTFLVFKRYVRRVRWRMRDLIGQESCRIGHGVMVFSEARLRLDACCIRRVPGGGIFANQSSSCTATASEVLQSGEEGVFVSGNARMDLTKVTIDDAAHSGCMLLENAALTMTDCTVQQCRGAGILAAGGSQLTAHGCTVTRNDCDGVRAKGHSSLTLSGCIIRANGLEAVRMASYGPCTITANQLLGTVWTNAPPEGTQQQAWLRNTILAAVEDGDVDSTELGKIMRCLKNAKVDEEKQRLVRVALEDGEMDEDDRALLMSICPKPTIAATEWHPKDGGRGSEKLEASLRRERTSTDLIGVQGQSSSGGQPAADAAVVIDPLTRALHRMVTQCPEVTKAKSEAAATVASADVADATAAAAGAVVAEHPNEHVRQVSGDQDITDEPPQMARKISVEDAQMEMEEQSKPVAAIWGNLDPRTQRRAISR